MLTYKPKNADAIVAMTIVSQQSKLIADIPSIITCMIVLFDLNIGNASTQRYIASCMEGFKKYNRLHNNQIPVVKDIILQHSEKILNALNDNAVESVTQSEKPALDEDALTSSLADDSDPFA